MLNNLRQKSTIAAAKGEQYYTSVSFSSLQFSPLISCGTWKLHKYWCWRLHGSPIYFVVEELPLSDPHLEQSRAWVVEPAGEKSSSLLWSPRHLQSSAIYPEWGLGGFPTGLNMPQFFQLLALLLLPPKMRSCSFQGEQRIEGRRESGMILH